MKRIMMSRRRQARCASRLDRIPVKTLSVPSLCLLIGFALGGHFFEPPPPPIYQSPEGTQIQTCFTPQQRCLPLIVAEIRKAKHEILIQAYQLTSEPIADALIEAHRKGVVVKVLADKSQESNLHSQLQNLAQGGIEVLIDAKPQIAHHKIFILDAQTLIGGSYNFSNAAEYTNAENLFILKNNPVIREYWENWMTRHDLSRPLKAKNDKKEKSRHKTNHKNNPEF